MGNRVQRVRTDVSEPQMAQAIIAAWGSMFGGQPSKEQVAMILAQNNLETGNRKSMWNFNVGNITTDGNGPYDYFDDLSTNEQVSPGVWNKMNLKYRAYPSLEEGTQDYLRLLSGSHYSQAWQHILHPDPIAFSKALKAAGYYTADEAPYTKGLTSLFNQSIHDNSYEQAMSGEVPPAMVAQQITQPTAPTNTSTTSFMDMLAQFVRSFASNDNKKTYKKILPNHNILIQIGASDHTSAIEFSRILCSALDEELKADAYPHTDGNKVEVECSIAGPAIECLQTVEQLSQTLARTFKVATKKIGGINIST